MDLPAGAGPLLIGTLLALTALSFVLFPLLQAAEEEERPAPPPPPVVDPDAEAAEGTAAAALREIEFDRATGKLSDEDYAELKATYTERALAETRRSDAGAQSVDDAVEAAIRAADARRPVCGSCGPRPESDAVYCSSCGRYLPGACSACGAAISEPGARFCTSCGTQVSAA